MQLLAFSAFLATSVAIDNGLGLVPPRGWRSWNQFQCHINQTLVESQYAQIASRSRHVDGVPTSLLDLGYATAGIDDCWQKCNSGPGNTGFHDATGYPIVDDTLFPNMRAMTSKAKGLGVTPGWYGNNCHCGEQRSGCALKGDDDSCFKGDVKATIDFGFESIKLDGCGIQKNITRYAALFNATGQRVLLENCHNGNPTYPTRDFSGKVDCPMNLFRSSTDIRPTFGSMLINLRSTSAYNGKGLTGPGCWAYPDMLEVGVTNSQKEATGCTSWGQRACTLDIIEARTHFSAWSIVSAPLVLGNDLTDSKTMDAIWPIISNREVLAVNEAWAGDSGVLVKQSSTNVHMQNCSWFNDNGCDHPAWMVWRKILSKGKVAVFLMNNAEQSTSVSVNFVDINIECPSGGCALRDLHVHKDLGHFSEFSASLAPHDSVLLLASGVPKAVEAIV